MENTATIDLRPSKEATTKEKRQFLRELSKGIKDLVKEGAIESVNEGLIEMYTDGEHHTFNTFQGWKKEGQMVQKGETAFLVWGKPRELKEGEENAEAETEVTEDGKEVKKFYPLAFLFSNAQVKPL